MAKRTMTTLGLVVFFVLTFYLGIAKEVLALIALLAIIYEVLRFENDGCMGLVVMVQMMGLFLAPMISNPELVWLMLIVGAGDVMAIIGGKYLNPFPSLRPFPEISQGKTVVGYLWGFVAGVGVGWGFNKFWPVPLGGWAFPFIFYFAAALGDLSGSKWKRIVRIKDSGKYLWTEKVLPGHGGLVDRFGALAMALWVWLVLESML